jgi:hypothetical protein
VICDTPWGQHVSGFGKEMDPASLVLIKTPLREQGDFSKSSIITKNILEEMTA